MTKEQEPLPENTEDLKRLVIAKDIQIQMMEATILEQDSLIQSLREEIRLLKGGKPRE